MSYTLKAYKLVRLCIPSLFQKRPFITTTSVAVVMCPVACVCLTLCVYHARLKSTDIVSAGNLLGPHWGCLSRGSDSMCRVANRPVIPGTSRILASLSRVPA